MKPLNDQARKMAFQKFLGLYMITMLIPVLACCTYFILPESALRQEEARLLATFEEQKQLLAKIDTLARQSQQLIQLDEAYGRANDDLGKAVSKRQATERETEMNSLIFHVRNDTAQLLAPMNKQLSKSAIRAFNAILTYRNTIAFLRQSLEKNGIDVSATEKLKGEIAARNQKIDLLKLEIKTLELNMKNKPAGGGGSTKITKRPPCNCPTCPPVTGTKSPPGVSQEKFDEVQAKVAFAHADCDRMRADGGITSWSQRKQLYQSSLRSFQNLLQTTTNASLKTDIQHRLDDINKKLKDRGD
jgi:hypothetical protein